MPIALTTTSMEKIHHQRFLLSALILELLTAVALLLQLQLVSAGSCREAQLCCAGRDSSCVVQKTPINAIIEDLNDKPCYCDHACLKLGDCCGDFKDHCGGKFINQPKIIGLYMYIYSCICLIQQLRFQWLYMYICIYIRMYVYNKYLISMVYKYIEIKTKKF
ncbi:PREDICTED: uncharacterized protein LOC108380561 isoform X2 [Rhagoletis zephyria]|nr:PREDICTED: uncharacterized protein LOC108380561 isoform X2 [Rhagoletis zephyria]